jgi:hypothetical protein
MIISSHVWRENQNQLDLIASSAIEMAKRMSATGAHQLALMNPLDSGQTANTSERLNAASGGRFIIFSPICNTENTVRISEIQNAIYDSDIKADAFQLLNYLALNEYKTRLFFFFFHIEVVILSSVAGRQPMDFSIGR